MLTSSSDHRPNRGLRNGLKVLLCALILVLLRFSPAFASPATLVSLSGESAQLLVSGSASVDVEGEAKSPQALAVDSVRGVLWIVGDSTISVHDALGTKLFGAELEQEDGSTSDRRIAIANDGSAWIGAGKHLWNLGLGGQVLQRRTFDEGIVDFAIAGNELWVGAAKAVTSLDARSGAERRQLVQLGDQLGEANIDAMTVVTVQTKPEDEPRHVLWVSGDNRLLRFDDGALTAEIELPFDDAVRLLADDGAGGLWFAAGTHLGHLAHNASRPRIRQPLSDLTPEDSPATTITALASDAGSAWITGGLGLRQISRSGWTLDASTVAEPILALAVMAATADDIAPTLAIELPVADQVISESRPELRFAYSDDASGILEGSLEILVDGEPVAVGCSYLKDRARCRPNIALADGEMLLEAAISDVAGNRSEVATRVFTIDTERSDDGEPEDDKPPATQGGADDTVYTPVASPRGFRPNQPYQLGEIDAVDTASGNVTFRVPLGQVYEVGPMISYQIQAVNNSNAWDHVPIRCNNPSSCDIPGGLPTFSLPNAASNAGLGWEVHFGKLFSPTRPSGLDGINWDRWPNTNMDPSDDDQRWMYVAPDGARYYLYSLVGRDNGSGNTIKRYSKDGSFLRMSQINTNTIRIEFPDGRYSVFEKVGNVSAGTEFCGNGVSGC